MLTTAAVALSLVGALNTTPAPVDQLPTQAMEAIESVQQEITKALEPQQAPIVVPIEPEEVPEETEKPVIEPYGTVLGTCTTSYSASNKNRSTNIRLAATAINGTVLQPGESFSFNQVVGKRTAARGYKVAGIFSGGKADTGIGGGICQVSSTLFNAALLSNMTITSRTSHGLAVSYLPAGRDATVSWGGPEFKFKNSLSYPVKITAGYDSIKGILTINILGPADQTAPDVKISVKRSGSQYITTRYVNGKANYTTKSYYKNA